MDARNMLWIGRNVSICSSTDSTLVGRTGLVIDETKRTIKILENEVELTFAKDVIKFTLDDAEQIIDGSIVGQRPGDRIHRRYRK
jgi:RNase P/RNase MRP subunit p29